MLNNIQTIFARITNPQNVAYLMLILFGTLLLFGVFAYNSERKRLKKKSNIWSKVFQLVLLISGLMLYSASISFYLFGESIFTSEYLPNIALSLLNLSFIFIVILLMLSFRSNLFKTPKIIILFVISLLGFTIGMFTFCSPSYKCGIIGNFISKIIEINGYLLGNLEKLTLALVIVFAICEVVYLIYKKMRNNNLN